MGSHYRFKPLNLTSSYTPIHTHLCIQYSTYLYIVPKENTLTIRKIDTSDASSELIVTEDGSITKFYHDRANNKLYYYHNQSTFSYVDLTDDSITDLDDTLDAVEDLFVYDGSLFAVDTSQDDLTYYKYTSGAPGTWGAVGTVAEGKTNAFDIGALGGNDNLWDICWDGTYFYITDLDDSVVYKYNSALNTLVDSYDIGALGGNDNPMGICWDGTYFYITDEYDSVVYKYNSALDTLEDSFDVSEIVGGIYNPHFICWDGTYFYIIIYNDSNVYKYNADFSSLVDTIDIGALGGNDVPAGICWDGTYFYVTDNNDHVVYKYNSALDTLVDSFDIGALGGNDFPRGICWDGSYFYTTDLDDYAYVYSSDLKTELGTILYTAVISDKTYTIYQYITGDCKIYVKDLDDSNNPTLLETFTTGYIIPYLEAQRGVSVSADNNVLYFVLKKESDTLTYLCTYNISGDSFSVGGEYNIALQLDRNNSATFPNEYEKAFGISNEIVYETKTRRGGVIQLQDLSDLSDANIIAITDNFCMNNDGDMFEWTEVMEDMMFENRLHRGIFPYRKKYTFMCHPDYAQYWNKKDSLKVYDVNNGLCFWGSIISKNRDNRGGYSFECNAFSNEIYETIYTHTYSGDASDTKQQDIIDNAGLFYIYRSSSITTDPTTNYDYEFNHAISHLFHLTRFLERQVCYIEADGKIYTKSHDDLVATGKSWTLNDGNQNVYLLDIKGLDDQIPGYYSGNTGITSVSVIYKNGVEVVRPASPSELTTKKRLNPYTDYKIQELATAQQLGDNLYNIFSTDTIFLGLIIEGEGYMEPGETIEIEATDQITITKADFMIQSYIYDPKNDRYLSMLLSDNIITPKEFKSGLKVIGRDIQTTLAQAGENQANIANIDKLALYGSANKEWQPCVFIGTNKPDGGGYTLSYQGVPAYGGLLWQIWDIRLPTSLGDYKLYIDGIRIGVFDADANDYIDNVILVGHVYDGSSDLQADGTNRTTQGLYTYTLTVEDMSDQERGSVIILNSFTDGGDLDISSVSVRCYYA